MDLAAKKSAAESAVGRRIEHAPSPPSRDTRGEASAVEQEVWSARDTTPAAVEQALRDLLIRYHAMVPTHAPARALTLLVVVDQDQHAALERQLLRVARRYASRTVVALLKSRQDTLDATVRLMVDARPARGAWSITHEHVLISLGKQRLPQLESIIRPLLLRDVPALAWSPAISPDRLHPMLALTDTVLLDTVTEPSVQDAFAAVCEVAVHAEVVDLAWLRSVPWRERVAELFDPPCRRAQLNAITAVDVRHHPGSRAVAMLFLGWLASRLGWTQGQLVSDAHSGDLIGGAMGLRHPVSLSVRCCPERLPGLAGVTIATTAGVELSLDRGPGGLRARCSSPGSPPAQWTLLGASRREPGILRDGIRAALLRDATYLPALRAGAAMLAAPEPCPPSSAVQK